MIGKILRLSTALFTYFCIATVIALCIGLAMLWSKGSLESGRLMQVVAVMQGVDLAAMQQEAVETQITLNPSQPSIEEIIEARALGLRQIEMKEVAVTAALQQVDDGFRNLEDDKQQFELVRADFQEELDTMYDDALVTGREEARLLLENLKPKQAKEQILQMLENGEIDQVVTLLTAMPISKRGKIAREFKAQDEVVKLAQILERVREGAPDADIVDEVRADEQPNNPAGG